MNREPGVECHTFTIIGHCARTGLLGVALASSPLAVAARCVFIRANAGAVSTQAYAHPGLGPVAIRLLEMDYSPEKVLKELRETDAYPEHRQIGVLDRHGNPGVYTGTRNMDWKGHIARKHFVAMGNYLVGEGVVTAMAEAFEHSGGDILEERLMRALEAGQAAGGERGGQLSSALTVSDQIGTLEAGKRGDVVALAGELTEDPTTFARVALVVQDGRIVREEAA